MTHKNKKAAFKLPFYLFIQLFLVSVLSGVSK